MWSVGIEAQMPKLRTRNADECKLFKMRPTIARFLLQLQRIARRLPERQPKPSRNAGRSSQEAQAGKNGRIGKRSEGSHQQDANARAPGEGAATCQIRCRSEERRVGKECR